MKVVAEIPTIIKEEGIYTYYSDGSRTCLFWDWVNESVNKKETVSLRGLINVDIIPKLVTE